MPETDRTQEVIEAQLAYGDCGDLTAIRRAHNARILANFRLAAESFDPIDMSTDDISATYRAIGQRLIDETDL